MIKNKSQWQPLLPLLFSVNSWAASVGASPWAPRAALPGGSERRSALDSLVWQCLKAWLPGPWREWTLRILLWGQTAAPGTSPEMRLWVGPFLFFLFPVSFTCFRQILVLILVSSGLFLGNQTWERRKTSPAKWQRPSAIILGWSVFWVRFAAPAARLRAFKRICSGSGWLYTQLLFSKIWILHESVSHTLPIFGNTQDVNFSLKGLSNSSYCRLLGDRVWGRMAFWPSPFLRSWGWSSCFLTLVKCFRACQLNVSYSNQKAVLNKYLMRIFHV